MELQINDINSGFVNFGNAGFNGNNNQFQFPKQESQQLFNNKQNGSLVVENLSNNFYGNQNDISLSKKSANETWEMVMRSNENDEFIRNPEAIIKELDIIAASAKKDLQLLQQQQQQQNASNPTLPSATNTTTTSLPQCPFPPLDVASIIAEGLIPTPPTEIIEIVKPEYMKYVENNPNVNFSQVFEQKSSVDVTKMDPRALSLVRYREKRLKRVFNRVRYGLRKQVSEARPRVKGRFIKSSTEELPAEEKLPLPLSSSNPPLEVNSPSSIPSSEHTALSPPENVDTSMSIENLENSSCSPEEPNQRKRKPSFFRIGSRPFFSGFSSSDNIPPTPKTGSLNSMKRILFSFSKSASEENPSQPSSYNLESTTGIFSNPSAVTLESGKRRKSWSQRLGFT